MMDAGGSPFPHNNGASVDGGTMVVVGTVVSGACCSDPTGGSTIWGPTSMGSVLGKAIIPLSRMSGVPVSRCCRFLEVLLSKCSAMSESVTDSHSHHSHVAEVSVCFLYLCPPFGGGEAQIPPCGSILSQSQVAPEVILYS